MPLKPVVLHSCYFVVCWLVGFLFVIGFLLFGFFVGFFFVPSLCKNRTLRVPHDVLGKVTGGVKCVFVGCDS